MLFKKNRGTVALVWHPPHTHTQAGGAEELLAHLKDGQVVLVRLEHGPVAETRDSGQGKPGGRRLVERDT